MNYTGIQEALIPPKVVEFIVPADCDDETIREFTNNKMNKAYFKKYTETADPLTHVVKLNDGSFEILNEQQFVKKYRHITYVSPSIYDMLMHYQELYTDYQDYYIEENDIDNISKYTQAISIIKQMIECNHMLHELVNED